MSPMGATERKACEILTGITLAQSGAERSPRGLTRHLKAGTDTSLLKYDEASLSSHARWGRINYDWHRSYPIALRDQF